MKKLLFILTLCAAQAQAASYLQRYGADSPITNLPLFFKRHYYKDTTPKVQTRQTEAVEVATTKSKRKCGSCVAATNRKAIVHKNVITPHADSLQTTIDVRSKKSELEREKQRLQQMLLDLERQQQSFDTANV